MKKIAIFVEGHSELIFIREFLLKRFDYQHIDLECRTLFKDDRILSAEYDFPNENAPIHFQVINVGSDVSVLQRILKREEILWNAGYERIIGLRDMYSDEYKEAMGQPREIKPLINQKFINGYNDTIKTKAIKPDNIYFYFAIMELETWFLGIPTLWQQKSITSDMIQEILKVDFFKIDPETTFLHPTETIKALLELIGEKYDKHDHEINSFLSYIEKEDFENLLTSQKCNSFKLFNDCIF